MKALLWPLFLTAPGMRAQPYEIVTCATALGLMLAVSAEPGARDGPARSALASQALVTLISLRRADGSWPSIQVSPNIPQPNEMEGVVNDTIFALRALVASGFLEGPTSSRQPTFPNPLAEFRNFGYRLNWLLPTINWIERNRVADGWYYTAGSLVSSNPDRSPAVGPTACMVSVLDDISNALPLDEAVFRSRLIAMRDAGIRWLLNIQHRSGGFGRHSRDVPRLAHTSLSLLAILRGGLDNKGTDLRGAAARATRWLMVHGQPGNIHGMAETESFDEYEQALTRQGSPYLKRVIAHEHPIEPLLLLALTSVFARKDVPLGQHERNRMMLQIPALVEMLLKRQHTEGPLKGAFQSRRAPDSEKTPIYWIFHATTALVAVSFFARDGTMYKRIKRRIWWSIQGTSVVTLLLAYSLLNGFDARGTAAILLVGIAGNILSLVFTRK